jgi:3'-phosphoadenosine 5'-phosphosulfate sulfotransferase (PAPS reductase)/FAD synthetase
VRATLAREITGKGDVCLTCSFQAEDVLLTKLAIELDAKIPILFLDTGYHFAETYAYRDRIAREWQLNLINLLPEKPSPSRRPSMACSINPRPTSAASCARSSRSSRRLPAIACGSPGCGASRQRAARRLKNRRCSRFPAASRC